MPPTRRRLLQAAMGSVAGAVLGSRGLRVPAAFAQAPDVSTERLDDTLHVLNVAGNNVLAHADTDGVVLVDGGPAGSAATLLDAVSSLPRASGQTAGSAIHTLFNTHWHPEQTGSNQALAGTGATIIAQQNTRLWLSTDITYPWDGQHFEPLPEAARPNSSFFDEGELDSGVQYGYLRHAAHTDGDLYVKFPEANVIAVGGAASGAGWPLVDWWTGGWIGGIVGTMELLLALSDRGTRFVPARGPVLDRAEIEAQFEMYNTIYERLAQLLNTGRGPDEAVDAHPTEEFDAKMGPPDEFVRRAFESLWAYLSPDA